MTASAGRRGRQLSHLTEIRELVGALDQNTHQVLARLRDARGALSTADPRAGSATNGEGRAPLIAFVHIPKTAGGTATTMFVHAYSAFAIHKAGNYMRGPEGAARKLSRDREGWERWQAKGGRVTVGHVPYASFREANLPRGTLYMTFLREPVDRVLSHYYRHVALRDPSRAEQVRQRPNPRPGRRARAASIEHALVEMRIPQLRNLATRFLCDDPSPGSELSDTAVEEAKANLREFAFVGIQERFDESLVLLQRMLGLDATPYLNRHVSSDRPTVEEISDAQRELIVEHNQLDIELYASALGLFQEAVEGAGEGYASDVDALRASSATAKEEHEAAVRAARDWLARELPPGCPRPVDAVKASADAAEIPERALKEASRQLEVRSADGDGARTWIRR